ncbi:diguanylate cyclase [Persephonella sp.]
MKSSAVRKFTYITVAVITVAFLILSMYEVFIYRDTINTSYENIYIQNKNSFKVIQKEEKDLLLSLAVFIAEDKKLKEFLKNQDRERAFNLVREKWNLLRNRFNLNEIHIIDKHGISFVNFIDYGSGDFGEKDVYSISSFRKDINRTLHTGKPVSTLFVCRYFVGYRAIYPIKLNGELIGAVSVGKSIEDTLSLIRKYLGKNSFALLDKDYLEECMKPDILKEFSSKRILDQFVVVGNKNGISIEYLKHQIKMKKDFFSYSADRKDFLLSVFPIKDFKNITVGYMVFQDDVTYLVKGLSINLFNLFAVYIFLLVGIVLAIGIMNRSLEKRISEIEEITEKLAGKDFSVLEKYQQDKSAKTDDITKLKNNIIKMGRDLHKYIIEINKQMLKLSEETYTDPLLGILNRRALMRVGNTEFEKARMRKIPLSVMVLDLDNFKQVNDSFGHDAGDKVLKDFVDTVRGIISTRDLFFRIGGEEFLLILPGADIKIAHEIAEKIRKEVEKRTVTVQDSNIRYTVSIGIAQMTEEDQNIYTVISRADDMLYRAKRAGRNRVES